jgi:catechol 2,3-dioxygenase-like lactoylglutathione lyase family enzyme
LTIVLDHTIVPARDKEESARFFARIFGLEYKGPVSHFSPVRINETLTIDFDNWDSFERHHYAFKVGEAEFDGIFDRVLAEGLAYGSGPRSAENMEINHRKAAAVFTSATRTVTYSRY